MIAKNPRLTPPLDQEPGSDRPHGETGGSGVRGVVGHSGASIAGVPGTAPILATYRTAGIGGGPPPALGPSAGVGGERVPRGAGVG